MSRYTFTPTGHRLTTRQAEALDRLVRTGGRYDVTRPPFLLGTWGNTRNLMNRLKAAGLADLEGNTYTVTAVGRAASNPLSLTKTAPAETGRSGALLRAALTARGIPHLVRAAGWVTVTSHPDQPVHINADGEHGARGGHYDIRTDGRVTFVAAAPTHPDGPAAYILYGSPAEPAAGAVACVEAVAAYLAQHDESADPDDEDDDGNTVTAADLEDLFLCP